MSRKTTVFENGLIWFGAAISIAEIITGTLFAPLGFAKGILAVVIGHIIGCTLMYFSGYIGGKTGKSSMEAVALSFGYRGNILFSVLNIIQLVGWTAIMIYDGALAAHNAISVGSYVWSIVIGALIILWILIGVKNLGKLNTVSMTLLFLLTIVLSFIIFNNNAAQTNMGEAMSFGAAVELSVAMPLSWLPLISDYTREAQKPAKASFVSVIVYGLASCWMYIIGMGAAIMTGTTDIADVMTRAGLGVAGLFIIVLSTTTTTFLDAYSAGVSGEALSHKINAKWVAVAVTIIGVLCSILFPITDITDFLYLIGSVFAPMIAIQIADFFILKSNHDNKRFCVSNLVIWAVGFVIYRFMMNVDFVLGNTLPAMVIIIAICVVYRKIVESINK